MSTSEHCNHLEVRIEKVHQDLHNHIRELRADFSDLIEVQESRHQDTIRCQEENTKAI